MHRQCAATRMPHHEDRGLKRECACCPVPLTAAAAAAGGLSWNQQNEAQVDVDGNDCLQGLRFDALFVRVHVVTETVIT